MHEGIKVRPKLIEMWTRLTTWDKKEKIFNNGGDNMYPNELERVIMNSPTGSRSAMMLLKFIAGRGVRGENIIVNKRKQLKLTDFIRQIAKSIAYHNGVFIHISYGIGDQGKVVPKSFQVLDYIRCRISKEDDNEYPGEIVVKDWEKKTRFSRDDQNKAKRYYPFNPDEQIVLAQINGYTKEGDFTTKLNNYCGQVLYVNLTPEFKYAVSKFDPVYNDMDTEYRMSLYSNTITRGGFLGKLAVLTQGLDPDKSEEVVEDVQKWLGAENASHIYHLDVEHADDLDKVLKVVQIDSQYDDQMFTNLDKRIIRNITGSANNIPEGLIYSDSGVMFGGSGSKYVEMKQFYDEQTEMERQVVEEILLKFGIVAEIVPLGEVDEEVLNETDDIDEDVEKVDTTEEEEEEKEEKKEE